MTTYSDPFEDRNRGRGADRPADRPGERHRDRSAHRHRDRSITRTRDRDREPDRDRRDTHTTKLRNDRGGGLHDRRERSRSPRRERGGRRGDNNRYRSRSPLNKPERGREPPKGPRVGNKDARPSTRPTGPSGEMEGNTRKDKPDQGGPVKAAKPATTVDKDVKMTGTEIPEGVDEETWEMIKVMGFGTFKTTKNTKVPGNDRNYCVRKDTMMKARQYMNRQGGFNRPLSPGR